MGTKRISLTDIYRQDTVSEYPKKKLEAEVKEERSGRTRLLMNWELPLMNLKDRKMKLKSAIR